MKNKLIAIVLTLVVSCASIVSCGTGSAIVFDKGGIKFVPGEEFVILKTDKEVEVVPSK